MKKAVLFIILSLNLSMLQAQEECVYPFFFRVMEANQPITYLAHPFVSNFLKSSKHKKRVYELEEAEGGRGYLLEPSLDLNFPIIQGKVDGRPFWNTSRISIHYGFNTRVVNTKSSPILPPTNRIGIRVDKILFETVSGTRWFPWSFKYVVPVMPEVGERIHLVYFSALLEHYSNGQNGDKFKFPTSAADPNRNNYLNGDFSTNFFRFNFTYSGLYKKRTLLFTASMGMQFDFGRNNGILTFFEEQNKRYGKVRLLNTLQVRLLPINDKHEIRIRLENQLIFCDCANYPYEGNRYRNGTALFFEYNPLNLKTIGLLIHFYRGRDYLNIRYDDPIFIGHIGMTISLNKYNPLNKVIPNLLN